MSVPKSVTKIKKDGIEFTSSVDWVQYSIFELTRAALRDVGKFICNRFRQNYYSAFKRRKGRVGRFTQYWVRANPKYQSEPDLQVGLKPNAFYGGYQEVGSSKTPRLGLLMKTVNDNIGDIVKIESKYLSALNESESAVESLINEGEYQGGAEE